jgi:hypothetical protein
MTPGERSLWCAVYAASWHQPTSAPMGAVTDDMRALWSATQAWRAVRALGAVAESATGVIRDEAEEVLR